jgi:predicted AlkP superfamily phosphohydrolase/phosphomutase/tetratricopeptide (TPR) repeat protein
MPKAFAKRVLLLGWDAADWRFLTPLLDSGKMPNLRRLIEGGVSGRIATLQPILSPILWTSIATGKRGDKHGVLSFVEPTPDGSGIRTVGSASRKTKALWNILSQLGRCSVVVNWFASHPAEPIRGAIVSNRFSEAALGPGAAEASAFHPRDLAAVMEKLRVTPPMLTPAQMLPFFLEKLPKDDDPRLLSLAQIVAQCASTHNAATYLAEAEDWDFLAVYYDMIDHTGHGFAEYAPPRMPHVSEEDFQIFRHVIESTYRYHDLMLGRWLELADDETAVIVLSDHGFYHGAGRPLAERGRTSGDRPKGVHTNPLIWHRLHGVFVAHGPGIKSDTLMHSASLLDVAPTLLALLGLPVPEDFEGQVLRQIFSHKIEIETVPSYEPPHPDDGMLRDAPPEDQDPWAAQQALLQLAELGYIEAPSANGKNPALRAREAHDSHLAQIYFATARFSEALELLNDLVTRSPDPSYRCRQAMCFIGLGRLDQAEAIIREVLAATPHYGLAKMLAGQTALMKGKEEEAESIFQALSDSEAQMPMLHNQVAAIYLRQGKWEEAAALFRSALEADPDFAEAHDGLGVALRHLGRMEDSIFEHMRAISLQHDRAQTHINLGISLAKSRQFNWAIRAFEVAANLAPAEPYPHRCLARIYRRGAPDRDKAVFHLLRARELRRKLGRATPAFRHGV